MRVKEGAQHGLWPKTQLSLARASHSKDGRPEGHLHGRAEPGSVASTHLAGIYTGNMQRWADKSSSQAVPNTWCQP